MLGNKPSRSANAILYVVSPRKLFEGRITKKAKTTTTATHASRIRSEPWRSFLIPLVNKQTSHRLPPHLSSCPARSGVTRAKHFAGVLSPLAVGNSKGACAGSRR